MKPATRRALRLSIKKWEKIVAGTGVDNGGFNCALCNHFTTGVLACTTSTGECCPVALDSCATYCANTPYVDWLETDGGRNGRARDDESVMCAQLELEYLRSLDK